MKVLNLYAGLGGNRKLWTDVDVTAVEMNEDIASIYSEQFQNDTVIVGDAHEFLLNHYNDFDFIWSSPPCPTHSRTNYFLKGRGVIRYPDMSLWQEIIFLKHHAKCKYVVENVVSYYEPILNPKEVARHYFWTNFRIAPFMGSGTTIGRMNGKRSELGRTQGEIRKERHSTLGFNVAGLSSTLQEKALNNCVDPELGLHVFKCALGSYQPKVKQTPLFQ